MAGYARPASRVGVYNPDGTKYVPRTQPIGGAAAATRSTQSAGYGAASMGASSTARSGGGGRVEIKGSDNTWSDTIANLKAQKAVEAQGLINEGKAQQDAANQAVTARMDSEARNQAASQTARARTGLFAGDGGGGTRTVSVNNSKNQLAELVAANRAQRDQQALGAKYGALAQAEIDKKTNPLTDEISKWQSVVSTTKDKNTRKIYEDAIKRKQAEVAGYDRYKIA